MNDNELHGLYLDAAGVSFQGSAHAAGLRAVAAKYEARMAKDEADIAKLTRQLTESDLARSEYKARAEKAEARVAHLEGELDAVAKFRKERDADLNREAALDLIVQERGRRIAELEARPTLLDGASDALVEAVAKAIYVAAGWPESAYAGYIEDSQPANQARAALSVVQPELDRLTKERDAAIYHAERMTESCDAVCAKLRELTKERGPGELTAEARLPVRGLTDGKAYELRICLEDPVGAGDMVAALRIIATALGAGECK